MRLLTMLGETHALLRHDIRRRAVPLAIGLAVVASLVMGLNLYQMRLNLLERSREEATNLSIVMSGQVVRTLEGIEIALDDLSGKLSRIAERGPELLAASVRDPEFRFAFKDRLQRLSQASAIAFVNADGQLTSMTRDNAVGVDASDRDYFTAQRDAGNNKTFVGTPVVNRITGATTIFFSRRVTNKAGAFLGVLAVGYEPRNIVLGQDAQSAALGRSVVLSRHDGLVLFHSTLPNAVGTHFPPNSIWQEVVKVGGGRYDSPGYFDGNQRVVAIHLLKESPLVISASVLKSATLTSWWSIAIGSVVAFTIIGGIFALLLRLLLRQLAQTEASEERLKTMAHQDALTALPNRTYFRSALERSNARASRIGAIGAVLFIDLDRFKKVNDSLGHAAGDELLILAAARLKRALRTSDLLARVGGDEFIVLADDLAHDTDAGLLAGRLIDQLRQSFVLSNGREIFIGGSIGIAMFAPNHTADALIQAADTALYAAKAVGGGVYKFYDKALTSNANKRLDMDARMRHALSNGEFVLHYQPTFDLRSRAIVGVEALVRWNDPIVGMVSPLDFIPLAEESGFIVALGDWVTETACTQMAAWSAAGMKLSCVTINVSVRQFQHSGFVERCAEIVTRSGVEPKRVILEITESALMEGNVRTADVLQSIRALGLQIAIDDFGSKRPLTTTAVVRDESAVAE